MSGRKAKGLPNRSLPSHWQYVTSPAYSKIADRFPDSGITAIMAASRRMWIAHADPLVIMRLAGLKEVQVDDDLKTIRVVFEGKTMVFRAEQAHAQDDLGAQMRIAIMVDTLCRSMVQ